ncbi:hypothetical protein [Actinophytocola oryzae]|uniref:Secreted protein n=1 Tax=Actinophytocola oryzae TaxID=502181 RepID=A0A4R7VMF7_9PSEU|nr:hypothetical protein [Actinophytocola oryzae]TDV50790.1 hypothetical protein CLV71_106132 [Actinophytocola oryzae]
MTQASSNVPQTAAAFARRLVCRSLTVLGGMAAGTALAWCLSSTTASADTEVPATDVPGVVGVLTAPVTEPLRNTSEAVVEQLQDPLSTPANVLGGLGDTVEGAAESLDTQAGQSLLNLPSCETSLCVDDERHMTPLDGLGRSDLPTAPAPAPGATQVAPGVAVDSLVPNKAKDRSLAYGMSRRGSPAPAESTAPGMPDWPAPLPFAPAGVPTMGNFSSSANGGDSHLFTAVSRQDRYVDLAADGTATTADSAISGRPHAQPGVVPD